MFLLLLLAGCPGGTRDGDLDTWCAESATPVPLDEATTLGFSGAELYALAAGKHSPPFTWNLGGEDTLTLTVGGDPAEARFVDASPAGDEGADSGWMECPDRVEVDVSITFVTGDGRFAEAWDTALSAETVERAGFVQELDLDHLDGSYDPADDIEHAVEDTPYESVEASVIGWFDGAGTWGTVAGQVNGEEECEDDGTCSDWAAELPIGAWGTPPS